MPSERGIKFDPSDDWYLAGYRVGGEWVDVEETGILPRRGDWPDIDLVTINLRPDLPEGAYRNVGIFGGLDPIGEGFDIYSVVGELQSEYPFLLQ